MGKGDRKTRKGKRFIGSRKKRTKLNCYGINPKIQKKIMDYNQEIDYAIKNNIAKYDEIFDFIETPNEKWYKILYLFCRENLDIHYKRKSISHSSFLYSNDYSINAKANIEKNAIFINIGLMKNCIDKYLYNNALNDFIESKDPDLYAKFDSSPSYLAFQINIQFTYYHELAHLFQFSQKTSKEELQERSNDDKFDIIRHKLEINADTYSAICISTHIQQYINNIFGDNISQGYVVKTITTLGGCLLEYIINFGNKDKLYYEKHSHPHPLIRLLNIILNITNHFDKNSIYVEKGVKLDAISLFHAIIDFHKELEDENIFTSGFSNLIPQYTDNIKEIISYISKIRNLENENEYTDALSIWNKHIKTLD